MGILGSGSGTTLPLKAAVTTCYSGNKGHGAQGQGHHCTALHCTVL